ncbi:Hypothetical Protein SLY_0263 [Strawberry lethal yellows phytoplasma (CPA) str. NZSb11]|uniref:Uncharacterized protein n=1 Tax=Strawberry lethal yellows phytoplasma (CPA) str. NZSb11 TaxID=980422 RepID=R4RLH1_PHYAS|nr:Hypothetical Protein SLY_0263 [Strawberry lethal yellows phytoplasma (CPA) str. NZSb11]
MANNKKKKRLFCNTLFKTTRKKNDNFFRFVFDFPKIYKKISLINFFC